MRNPQVTVDLNRDQIAALGLTVDQVELALMSSYGSRQVSQIFAADDQYQVILQVDPRYQRDPAALSMLYVQGAGRQAGAAVGGRHDAPDRRPAVGQPHRAVAVGDALVQPAPGHGARRRRRPRAGRRARDAARHGDGQLPGHGTGVPGLDGRPRVGARARHLRDLRRARHPLRELHPPDHDPLGPAVGRLRRPAHAAGLQARPEHLRLRRRRSCWSAS